jgi:hypothetical protein
VGVERFAIMTIEQFLVFLIFPIGCLIVGYIVARSADKETERFDNARNKPRHSH